MAATESQSDKLNRLYKEYGLLKEDVHKHQHYTIIRRTGIEKIAAALGIRLSYEVCQAAADYAAVKAIGKKPVGAKFATIETFGSACAATSQNKYYLEMAEKRAMSRAVLKLSDLYAEGVYGEDEADDFDRRKNQEPKAEAPRPVQPAAPERKVVGYSHSQSDNMDEPTPIYEDAHAQASEAQRQQLVQLIASPLLDEEERKTLLAVPIDSRPLEWMEKTLAKLPAVLKEREDPKKALAAAQNQLRLTATKYAAQLGEQEHKRWMLRADSLTAKPEELRAECRALVAHFTLQPA